jgi:hypothetical protein
MMEPVRTKLITYAILLAISIALAAGATLWLGSDGRIPVDMTAEGVVTKSASVRVLWGASALLLILFGSLALGAWGTARRQATAPVQLSSDATRSLNQYAATIHSFFVGMGILTIFLQAFSIVRAAGVAQPLGLDREGAVRLFFAIAGCLFVFVGNVVPKLPYIPSAFLDARRHFRLNRFLGWTVIIGGLLHVAAAFAAPFEQLSPVTGPVVLAMIVLPLLRGGWLMLDYRNERRRSI